MKKYLLPWIALAILYGCATHEDKNETTVYKKTGVELINKKF